VAVDTNGQVYGACSGAILAFAKGSVGNVKPTLEIEPAGDTAETFASDSWLSVATDASDNIYAPDANNNLNMVTEYAAGANDGTDLPALPGFEATGTGFSIPWGIAIDQTLGDIYVTNYASSTLEIFGSSSVLETGVPSITLTNGINSPFGVAVR
jgi:DNA-binding beta-propeller fold protein YncE